eukprot:SAG31_NODE_4009_length_3668_cov_17.056598_2_plen_216_part_00
MLYHYLRLNLSILTISEFHDMLCRKVLLLREDITLTELIQEVDFVEECRKPNKRLIRHLTKPNVLMELIGFIVNPTGDEDGLVRRYKFPFTACEAATSTPALIAAIVADELVLQGLFNFLQTDSELDPLLAGYFLKLLIQMMQDEKARTAEYIGQHPEVFERLLHHVESYSIKELLSGMVGAPFRRSMDRIRSPQAATASSCVSSLVSFAQLLRF